ncbi:hypothetical protein BP6252_07490 [Coleophoma cylindrospora]|uniref:Heterokaryon incompatibility domain-containing protein n=1 Tax=Coleophoma cylindrospora TaxID=1849047 RepID=A0A3D8RHR4_9HELO|nr:hypothetical protein BP6252_07490 [Coleophoma cylindrospora]
MTQEVEDQSTSREGIRAHGLRVVLGHKDMFTNPESWYMRPAKVVNFHLVADEASAAYRNHDVIRIFPSTEPSEDISSNLSQTQESQKFPRTAYDETKSQTRMLLDLLRECTNSHKECKKRLSGAELNSRNMVPLPTRCIEKVNGTYYLRETKGTCGSYVALSHRWTDATKECILSMANYHGRLEGRTFETMTRVFCDTIDLAERLGVRYVWIDSLCIIQDDKNNPSDFDKESVHMADYYQHAFVTISATSGTDEGGLFPERAEGQGPPKVMRLPYRDKRGERRGYFYLYKYRLQVNQDYQSNILKSGLFTRGWVYQERMLSRRAVCYTPSGMFFTCVAGSVNECHDLVTQPGKGMYVFEEQRLKIIWYKMVESYSKLSLTNQGDRISALIGIATEFKASLKQWHSKAKTKPDAKHLHNISGLWLGDILHGLLWQRRPPFAEDSGNELKRLSMMPNYSWTSITTPVYWPHRQRVKHACVLKDVKIICSNTSQSSKCRPPEHPDFHTLECQRLSGKPVEEDQFSQRHAKFSLIFEGRLKKVNPKDVFRNERDIMFIAVETIHKVDDDSVNVDSAFDPARPPRIQEHTGRRRWRKIYYPNHKELIAGWGSFDIPDVPSEIYAFGISTVLGQFGYNTGTLGPKGSVYNVLYVTHIGNSQYKRVGVGALCGKEAQQEWGENQVVELI